jgi:hypothetical protein
MTDFQMLCVAQFFLLIHSFASYRKIVSLDKRVEELEGRRIEI